MTLVLVVFDRHRKPKLEDGHELFVLIQAYAKLELSGKLMSMELEPFDGSPGKVFLLEAPGYEDECLHLLLRGKITEYHRRKLIEYMGRVLETTVAAEYETPKGYMVRFEAGTPMMVSMVKHMQRKKH